MLGPDSVAEVRDAEVASFLSADIMVCERNVRFYVEQFAHLPADVHVEGIQVSPFPGEERFDVVGIVFEERRLTVCALQCVPVYVAPVAVVADYGGVHRRRHPLIAFVLVAGRCWQTESLAPVCRRYYAAVAVGLLHETVVLLD